MNFYEIFNSSNVLGTGISTIAYEYENQAILFSHNCPFKKMMSGMEGDHIPELKFVGNYRQGGQDYDVYTCPLYSGIDHADAERFDRFSVGYLFASGNKYKTRAYILGNHHLTESEKWAMLDLFDSALKTVNNPVLDLHRNNVMLDDSGKTIFIDPFLDDAY